MRFLDLLDEGREPQGPLRGNMASESSIRRAADLSPDERAADDEFNRSPSNLAMLDRAIADERNPASRATLLEERARLGAPADPLTAEPKRRAKGGRFSDLLEPLPAAPQAAEKPSGDYLDAIGKGFKDLGVSLQAGRWMLAGGDARPVAAAIAEQLNDNTQTAGEREILGATKAVTDAAGAWDTAKAAGNLVWSMVSNPYDAGKMVAQQLPNAVPSMGTGAVGAMGGAKVGGLIGGATGASVGALGGGLVGLGAGSGVVEFGARLSEKVGEALAAKKLPATVENIEALLNDPAFRDDARTEGVAKGVTVGAIDALSAVVGGRIATAPFRAATRRVLARSGVDVSDSAAVAAAMRSAPIQAAVKAEVAATPMARKAGMAAAGIGADSLMEGAGEYAGEYAATGQGKLGEAMLEGLTSVGQSTAEVLGSRALLTGRGLITPAVAAPQEDRRRAIEDIARAPDVDTAVDAFNRATAARPAPAEPPIEFDRLGALGLLNAPATPSAPADTGESIPYDYSQRSQMYPALPAPDMPTGRPVLINDTDPELTRAERYGDREAAVNATQAGREAADRDRALGITPGTRQAIRARVTLDEAGNILEAPDEHRGFLSLTRREARPHAAAAIDAHAINPALVEAVLAAPSMGAQVEKFIFEAITNGTDDSPAVRAILNRHGIPAGLAGGAGQSADANGEGAQPGAAAAPGQLAAPGSAGVGAPAGADAGGDNRGARVAPEGGIVTPPGQIPVENLQNTTPARTPGARVQANKTPGPFMLRGRWPQDFKSGELALLAKNTRSMVERAIARAELDRRNPTRALDKLSTEARRNLWRAIVEAGGVNEAEAADIGIDPRSLGGYRMSGFVTAGGMRADILARFLAEAGYLTPEQVKEGGDEAARQMVADLLAREFVGRADERDLFNEALAAHHGAADIEAAGVDALPEVDRDDVADYDDSVLPAAAEEFEAALEADSNMTVAEAMRALGFTDEEISDAERSIPDQRGAVPQEVGADEPGSPPGGGTPDGSQAPRGEGETRREGGDREGETAVAEAAPSSEVDEAAHQAATSPQNSLPEPSEEQKQAGNYAKGHISIAGLDVSIENPAGSKRRPEWPTLKSHYGYFKRTEGNDGDHVDTFIRPGTPTDYDGPVFVVDQVDPKTGRFDEHKVMVGWPDEAAARAAYVENYTPDWRGLRAITRMDMPAFRDWLENGDTKAPAAAPSPEQPATPPVAESQAPGRSADGDRGVAPTRGGGGPEVTPQKPTGDTDATLSRFKPREMVIFDKPFVGKTGAKLTGYQWVWTKIAEVDKRGEDRVIRISDWERAMVNPETNREIVHQFQVVTTDGELHVVSAESAAKMLGVAQSTVRSNAVKLVEQQIREQEEADRRTREADQYDAMKAMPTPAQAIEGGDIGYAELVRTRALRDGKTWGSVADRYERDIHANREYRFLERDGQFIFSPELVSAGTEMARRGWKTVELKAREIWDESGNDRRQSAALEKESRPARPPQSDAEKLADKVESAARELARTIAEEARSNDFAPTEIPQAIANWAADEKVPADSLRVELLRQLDRRDDIGDGRKRQIREAVNPLKAAKRDFNAGRIEDVGEVLEGAKKHYAEAYRDAMRQVADADVAAEPLSKSWPAPDYDKLLEGGADPWTVAFVRAARDEVPAKPQLPRRAKRWADQVVTLRRFAADLLDGRISKADLLSRLDSREFGRLGQEMRGRVDLYLAVGHGHSLRGVRLARGEYTMLAGQHYDPPLVRWTVERQAAATAFSNWPRELAAGDTREAAIAAFKAKAETLADTPAAKQVSFGIYGSGGKVFIGRKVSGTYARLKVFDTVKEAREYLAGNRAELEKLWENWKTVPSERRLTNEPRVGVDHRQDRNVGPEDFRQAFGFRGIQFGNYVEQGRRQQDINDAYDALMDLAGIIDVPPRALSLNGRLGLAFGARGSGNASAHFEPGNVVINLTKTKGAGSLAHEWWHSLDNYFSRMDGRDIDYQSERGASNAAARPEMVAAFEAINAAVRSTSLRERSKTLDSRRAKTYWTTTREMTARAFESFVVAKLEDQGQSNDYLANIVSEDYWNAAMALLGRDEKSYPYPTAGEIPAIREAYQRFFDTIDSREEGGNVALFNRSAETGDPAEGGEVQAAIEGKDIQAAARWLAQNGPPANRAIAARVVRRLEAMKAAGVKFDLRIAHIGDSVPMGLVRSRGLTVSDFKPGQAPSVTVWLNGADVTGKMGTGYKTVLHELLHAATAVAIEMGNRKAAAGTKLAQDVGDLFDVTNAIIGHINGRHAEFRRGGPVLSEFEESIINRSSNALLDPHEVVAWALTDADAQAYLEAIPYEGRSMWSAFVQAIRKLLGLPADANTALSEVLRVSERLLDDNVRELAGVMSAAGVPMTTQQAMGSYVTEERDEPVFSTGDESAADGEAGGDAPVFSRRTPDTRDSKASALLTQLAKSDDLFQQPETAAMTVPAIAAAIDPGYKAEKLPPSSARLKNATEAWRIGVPGKERGGEIYGNDTEVWINVERLVQGRDGGSKIYGIAAAYAHNTGRVLIGDPAGLSRAAYFRRTENMLSSALKFGTTDHLAPHDGQINGKVYYQDNPEFAEQTRDMDWEPGNTPHNLRELMYTAYTNAKRSYPEIEDVRYNFAERRFERTVAGSTEVFDLDAFQALADRGPKAGGGRWAGVATLKRAALIGTLLRESRGEGWRSVLGEISRQLSGGLDPALRGTFYKRSNQAPPKAGLSLSAIQNEVERLTAGWANAPRVTVLATPADAPFEAPADANGALWRGRVYLFASNLRQAAEAEFVLFHESLGHLGLRGAFGSGLDAALRHIWLSNKNVRAEVARWQEAYGRDAIAQRVKAGMSQADARRAVHFLAIEEALADRAGKGETISGLKRLVAALEDVLRRLGMTRVADWLEGATDAEVGRMLAAARKFVTAGEARVTTAEAMRAVYSRSPKNDIEANIRRGRKAMNQAILNRADENRAMWRSDLGWIDFVWGDAKKGLAHILARRQDVDGMSESEVIRMLTQAVVDVIARGETQRRIESDGSVNLRVSDGDVMAILVKNPGSNGWLLSGFEVLPPGERKAGFDAAASTRPTPTPTRREGGAGEDGSIAEPLFSRGLFDASTADPAPPAETRSRVDALKDSVRSAALGAFTRRQLAEMYGRDAPEVAEYDRLAAAMDAERANLSQEADRVLQDWRRLGKDTADKLADIMHEATLAQFDPDTGRRGEGFGLPTAMANALADRFAALPESAKAVYRASREMYGQRLRQLFDALAARIQRSGADPDSARRTIDQLREQYDRHLRNGPYFPLARFGDYLLIATRKEPTGADDDRMVMSFESAVERDRQATLMKAKGFRVKTTVAKEYSRARDGSAGPLAEAMSEAIEKLEMDRLDLQGADGRSLGDLKGQLLDELNQALIRGLPELSYRKHFTHRKGTPGFSRDAMRAFADSQLHAANHIARLEYGDQLARQLDRLQERVTEADEGDVTAMQQVSNEMVKRHELSLNHVTHPVAAMLGQLGFFMSLGASVASGVVNLTQTPLVTYPWLAARFGWGKTSAAMTQAARDYAASPWEWESGMNAAKNAKLAADETAMLRGLEDRGLINTTLAHDLAGASSTDNLNQFSKYGSAWQRVMRFAGWSFHVPEVANRQITALATYRLARAGGKTAEAATEAAAQAITATHFDYSTNNRARYFEGNFRRVILMFKQYSQNIAYLYGRAAYQAFRGATPAEKREARRLLVGMLGIQFAAAGALGLPFVGTVASVIAAAMNGFADDDEEFDWQVEFRKWMASTVGKDMGEALSHGLPRLVLGWDVASRIGQSDLFVRGPNREQEGRDAYLAWMQALAGPVAGYALNGYLGVSDLAKGAGSLNGGLMMRGVEEMMPAAVRNALKAARYEAEDGLRTRGGQKQIELDAFEKMGQAMGFTPTRVSEFYEGMTAVKNRERRIDTRRQDLLDRYAEAVRERDAGGLERVRADIAEFNGRNPAVAIKGETLLRSMQNRRRREGRAQVGLYLPRNREFLRQEGAFANL